MDRLSDLPDSIIDRILSFLSMREAAVTAALGKRWRYLWTNVPNLKFSASLCECEPMCESCKKKGRFVDWVNNVLAVRTEPCVDKFEVHLRYSERCPSEIDAWIEYAVNSRVKHLELDLYSDWEPQMLPDTLYSCPSLEYLRISKHGLTIAPQRKIEWNALTELCFEGLELNQKVVDEIIFGCPVLYKWELIQCFGFKSLEINTRSLQILVVNDGYDGIYTLESVMQISAPYLQSLHILLAPDGRLFQLGDIGSLVNVYIEFHTIDDEQEVMNLAKGLLQAINHVKELKTGLNFFEVIELLEMDGWLFPQSRRRCLEVDSSFYYMLSGIIPLLESSPDLEKLVLEDYYEFSSDNRTATRNDLNGDLLCLKTIIIRIKIDIDDEPPVLTIARLLLKRATVLEYMEVVIYFEDVTDFIRIRQELLLYPRSSKKAELVVKSSGDLRN